MSKSTTTQPPRRWQDEPWASREAKKKDKPYKKQEPWKRRMKMLRSEYEEDPDRYLGHFKEEQAKIHTSFMDDIESGFIIEAGCSENPKFAKFQRMINRMARRSGLFENPPKLLIHLPDAEYPAASEGKLDAAVIIQDYISTNTFSAQYGVQHPEIFKVLMAHEMGHLANGDQSIEVQSLDNRMPPSQKQEILADRLGAIIHGKPRQYAHYNSELGFMMKKMAGVSVARSSTTYLSANANARMLHKWADILEREGATDAKGNVILDKAMAVFERSKDFTEGLVAVDLMAKYPQFSR